MRHYLYDVQLYKTFICVKQLLQKLQKHLRLVGVRIKLEMIRMFVEGINIGFRFLNANNS